MKLTFGLLLITMMSFAVESYSQSARINLQARESTIVEIFQRIEANTDVGFFFKNDQLDLAKKYTVNFKDESIDDVLNTLLGNDYSYRYLGNTVVISLKEDLQNRIGQQESKTVSGRITDSSGEPLPGVTVLIKGTTQGTITDFDGNYTITEVPTTGTLVFSFVGMRSQEILVGAQSTINVVMAEDAIGIEEVVAVGYGTVKKKDLTTAISTINSEELQKISASSFDQALKGSSAGLLITQTEGAPGSAPNVRIRGTNSISAGGDPLYVIDGVIMPNNSGSANAFDIDRLNPRPTNILATLNPNDIESVHVLKDAASTAVYGARGSNGVIIVNTKRGKSGEAKINLDYSTSVSTIAKKYPSMNVEEYITLMNRHSDLVGAQRVYTGQQEEELIKSGGTDWQDATLRKAAITHNAMLSASGGTDKMTYFLSGAYYDEEGLVIENDLQRYSIRANLETNLRNFKIGNSFTASYSELNDVPYGLDRNPESGPGVITSMLRMPPTDPIYKEDGTFFVFPTRGAAAVTNPVAIAKTQIVQYKTLRSLGNFFAEYQVAEGLVLRSTLGYDIFSRSDGSFYPEATTLLGNELGGVARRANTLNLNWQNENTINYNKEFGDHSLNVLGGATFQKSRLEGTFAGSSGFITDGFEFYNLGAGEIDSPPESTLSEWQVVSFLGRVSYNYKSLYLLNISGRYDGSSRLGKNDRFDFFPAVSAAWRVSEEPFFEELKNRGTSLKLRASYGVGGNDQIGNYSSFPRFNTVAVDFGNRSVTGVRPGSFGNPDIKWERTTQLDLGANIGFLNNALDVTIDYYSKNTTDLLAPRILASESGFESITVNAGEIENKGLELEVSANVKLGELNWNISANASFEKNRFVSLGEFNQADTVRTGTTARIVGQPLGTWFIPKFIGIYQLGEEEEAARYNKRPGDPKILDVNDDGNIIPLDDFQAMGLTDPNKYFGFTSNMSYKNWELSVFFQGAFGHRIYNFDYAYNGYSVFQGYNNYYTSLLDAWTPENPSNKIPRLDARINYRENSETVEKADYARLQNVTLGYNFRKGILGSLNISRLRLYVSGLNLATFTKFRGTNPEGNARGGYPLSRTIKFGVNVGF